MGIHLAQDIFGAEAEAAPGVCMPGRFTADSNIIVGLIDTTMIQTGQLVVANGVPVGTTVLSKASHSVTMSANATTGGTRQACFNQVSGPNYGFVNAGCFRMPRLRIASEMPASWNTQHTNGYLLDTGARTAAADLVTYPTMLTYVKGLDYNPAENCWYLVSYNASNPTTTVRLSVSTDGLQTWTTYDLTLSNHITGSAAFSKAYTSKYGLVISLSNTTSGNTNLLHVTSTGTVTLFFDSFSAGTLLIDVSANRLVVPNGANRTTYVEYSLPASASGVPTLLNTFEISINVLGAPYNAVSTPGDGSSCFYLGSQLHCYGSQYNNTTTLIRRQVINIATNQIAYDPGFEATLSGSIFVDTFDGGVAVGCQHTSATYRFLFLNTGSGWSSSGFPFTFSKSYTFGVYRWEANVTLGLDYTVTYNYLRLYKNEVLVYERTDGSTGDYFYINANG